MSVPQPIDNEKYQFITANKAEPTNKKVVELKSRQKPENMSELVSCWLAAESIENWLKSQSQKYPLTKQQALRLLGLEVEDYDNEEEREELLKFLEKQRQKKYKSITNYREELDLLNDIKRTDSRKIVSLINELEIRLENLYKDSSDNVDIDVVDEVDEFFWFIEDYLKKWYSTPSRKVGFISLSVALNDNSLRLRNQLCTRLEDLVYYGQESSLMARLKILQELEQDFQELGSEYLETKEECLKHENAFEKTYQRHLSFLKGANPVDNPCSREESFEIAKNALRELYRFKIEGKSLYLAAEIVEKLKSTNQLYIGIFSDSVSFLESIQESFLAEIKSDTMLPMVLESEQVDSKVLLKEVEKKVGHTLPSWGRFRGVTEEMVKSALLEELEPIAQRICSNTKTRLEQELPK